MVPKVTVLMLAYNSGKFIGQSVESVLKQTFADFELLIVFDESSDNTIQIISEFAEKDSRIKILKNENKKGIVGAANTGLKYAKGEYIARLDSDDIAFPGRLEKEADFLDKNKDFGLVGGGYRQIDSVGNETFNFWKPQASPDKIKAILLFENYFAQSTVMFRKSILSNTGFYDENVVSAEDYNLWVRMAEITKVWNFPEVFVYYRVHDASDTKKTIGIREKMLNITHKYIFEKIGLEYTPEELHLHFSIYNNNFKPSMEFLENVKKWFSRLKSFNDKNHVYNEKTFDEVLSEKWFEICFHSTSLGTGVFKYYFTRPGILKLTCFKLFKFLLKCIIKKG
jgi:glycosyltransferase involved in cell wall biosynthesis